MGFSVHSSRLAALLCLLSMGGGVWCECTEDNVQIEGGDYKLTKKLESGSLLIYNCPKGFYPYPALTRLCQANGTWTPAPKRFQPQRCRIVECPDPNVLENGNVSPPQERYFVDNGTSYECYFGYTLRGSSTRVCLPNGKWSGSTPICSHDTGDNCADPGIPPGASRSGNTFGIDDTVEYSCNSNQFLVGSRERVCQANGQWTGREPACYCKHYTYKYCCNIQKTIRIPKNGTLNIYIAVDISESIEEKDIQDAKNAVKQLISKISSFVVNPNYEIIFFACEIFEVINIIDFWDDKISLSTIKEKLETFRMGDKATAATDLNLVFKTFMERMTFIKLRVGEEAFKEHYHTLIVFTDGAYNRGGSPAPTVAKIKNMVYKTETQEREQYLDIYMFAIGAEIFDDDLQPLTVGTGGKHYFRLRDIENLQETFDEIIDEDEVKGLCGLHVEYDTTERDAKQKMYPWMALVAIQNEDPRKCLGSLVSREFILTAAHCLKFGDLPEHVRIEIDDGQGRVKKVKTFMIHPKYNVTAKVDKKVNKFYDYDVALIQLEKPVQISTSVRPICIPCTVETRNALQLVPDSTCKQQEQLLLKDHLERLTFLTRTENIVDEKEVHAKLGTNRDECIRHALQAPGINTDVVTDVVTDNFLCTGGRTPFRDHIACTGDGGGALFKNYEHRTIQVAVVSWGTKTLCRTGGVIESDGTSRDFHINLFRVVPFLKSILGNDNQDDYAPLTFLES
uniref:C3/C5 convertase n=1 Tax=Dicentrarchus labrax TaxID=13489 RepID=A0A8C4EHG7_DICLA